jgi:hypothetical protein
MMNLEVLFQSKYLTGNVTLSEIAIKHADTTMANHIRPDGRCPFWLGCHQLIIG